MRSGNDQGPGSSVAATGMKRVSSSFEKDALLEALKFYLAATKPLPPGILKSFDVQKGSRTSRSSSRLPTIQAARKGGQYRAGTIGAAMIAYCQRLRVPLPRTAEKSLLVSNGVLQLRVDVRGREPKFDWSPSFRQSRRL